MDEFDEIDIPMPPKQKVKGYRDGLLRAAEIINHRQSELAEDDAFGWVELSEIKQAILKEAE